MPYPVLSPTPLARDGDRPGARRRLALWAIPLGVADPPTLQTVGLSHLREVVFEPPAFREEEYVLEYVSQFSPVRLR